MDEFTTEELEDLRNVAWGHPHLETARQKIDAELESRAREEDNRVMEARPLWESYPGWDL